ncbi:uncharacterized protein LOC117543203 [Gymnodraco acuticeps]|uniref:Uncharacterized protein LOC117543203 n=1 Tax=Gymnodraco acuticeps TaxID=8218 RepID=A0A6P8TSN2_GYMAC|nr:uncharacterized protein LOC117543203 [Gymnodraco acuticeps]
MDAKVLLIFVIFGFGPVPSHSQAPLVIREYHYVNLLMNWTSAQHYCREKYSDLATFESMDDIRKVYRPSQHQYAWIGLSDDPQSWKGIMDTLPPGEKTYTLYDTQARAWEDAQTYCRAHHTDLAMIENAQENTDMLSITSEHSVWIGLYRVLWRWSDNSNSSFRNWNKGQPNNYFGNQYCGADDQGQTWHDVECYTERPFWCQVVGVKITVLRVKIQTDADLSDPATNQQILQQLREILRDKIPADFTLRWKSQPVKSGEDTD